MAANQTTFTISSGAHAHLLKWWARYTGRSMSSLISHLLENAVEDAIAQGKVPKNALSVMQSALDNMEEHFADDWQEETKDAPECPMF